MHVDGRLRSWRRLGTGIAALGIATFGVPITGIGAGVADAATTATPIQHLVVIFQENVSFDHYFGTYPNAANIDGQSFTAKSGTPSVNDLTPTLLSSNPNSSNPKRLANSLAIGTPDVFTCDQDHNYSDEQKAFDNGAMDKFVQTVGTGTGSLPGSTTTCNANDVMDYYDGNTVTALWNYAQDYAMSDNSFGTTFGPSAPGAINLVSGDTGGVDTSHESGTVTSGTPNADLTPDGAGGDSLTSDAQPYWDDCSTRDAVAMSGMNVGDLLNAAGLSWGWFQGGFRPTTTFANASAAVNPGQSSASFTPEEFSGSFTGKVVPAHASNQGLCDAVSPVGKDEGGTGQWGYKDDYIPHHEPFQYYASTANPHHLTIPTDAGGNDTLAGLATIGTDTQSFSGGYGVGPQFNTPNHNYDTSDFNQLVSQIAQGNLAASDLPAVSFLKAPGYEDGHAAYSDPLDEQAFVTQTVNALEQTPDWSSTAVVVSYDDSDGWYDHVYSGVTDPSSTEADFLTGTGACGSGTPVAGQNGRCGYGPRLPLLVISPYAKVNHVDHTLTDQSSILKFIEDNWLQGARIPGSVDSVAGTIQNMFDFAPGATDVAGSTPVFLDATTGQPTSQPQPDLPETPTVVALGLVGVAVMGSGVVLLSVRRRRARAA